MKYLVLLISITCILGCQNQEKSKKDTNKNTSVSQGAFAKSSGRTNTLTIVMDNTLWEGEIGNYLRMHLAAGVKGLPQDEPLFTIKQMSATAFRGFARKSRCFLRIQKGKNKAYKIWTNKYARPQIGIDISGTTNEEIIDQFLINRKEIITTYKQVELENRQSLIKKPLNTNDLKKELNIDIRIPRAYHIAKQDSNFFWIRKNINHGSMNILLYEAPISLFKKENSIIRNIINVRDSIGGKQIPVDDGGQFITEAAFSPFLKRINMLGMEAYETKGTWEVKNKYMAGPFINYTLKDTLRNRLLVLEGFVFAPSVQKRDYMFDLEAILKSTHLKE